MNWITSFGVALVTTFLTVAIGTAAVGFMHSLIGDVPLTIILSVLSVGLLTYQIKTNFDSSQDLDATFDKIKNSNEKIINFLKTKE